jgi:HD-like signal output (HDOD) protein
MHDVTKIIDHIDRLKPIPKVANKIMSIAEDPLSSMADLAAVIQYDQAITANLLKVANSPYFGLRKKADSIQQAITYLGMDQILDLVFIQVSGGNLKGEQKGYDLDSGELWKYSVSSAVLAKTVAEFRKIKTSHLVFTAALLKDIGKVILSNYVGQYLHEIANLVSSRNISFREAEKVVIGIDHAELGRMVARKWHFSGRMEEMIGNHHLDDHWDEDDIEMCIVYLADTLCMMMGISVGSDGLAYRFHRKVIQKLDLTEKDLQIIMASFVEKMQDVDELVQAA